MLILKTKADSAIIVLHEIYGINRHITEVCRYYNLLGYDIYCPNLLKAEKIFHYSEQEAAYKYFMENIGFKASETVEQLLKQIRRSYKKIFIIGFSIGATLAWLASASGSCAGIIGYYGSRIRDYLDITPSCPALLIFAKDESAFSPENIVKYFEDNNKLKAVALPGKHGFCDRFSGNFNPESDRQARQLTNDFITVHTG